MKRLLALLVFLAAASFAEEAPEQVNPRLPFSEMFLGIEGGELYPMGDLMDVLDNALYAQLQFRYSYYKSLDGYIHFGYSYLETTDDEIDFPGVHQFHGRVGVLWHVPGVESIRLGGGFSCIWARSDGGSASAKLGGMLSDNESEFGWHARLDLAAFRLQNWNVGFNAYWEQIWTLPERSNTLWFGVYVERRLR